jgi:hypothetical protein
MLNRFIKPWFWRSTHGVTSTTHDFDVQRMILTFNARSDVNNAWLWRSTHDFDVQRMILTFNTWFWRSAHDPTLTTHDFDVLHRTRRWQRTILTFNAWFWRSTHDFDVQRMILTFNAWFWRSTHDFDVQCTTQCWQRTTRRRQRKEKQNRYLRFGLQLRCFGWINAYRKLKIVASVATACMS